MPAEGHGGQGQRAFGAEPPRPGPLGFGGAAVAGDLEGCRGGLVVSVARLVDVTLALVV